MSERRLVQPSGYDTHQLSAAEIVRISRNVEEKNQSEFAADIKKTQSLVSKYERGEVDPPGDVIIHCMTILDKHKRLGNISLDEVVFRLQQSASLPEAPLLFRAILGLIDVASSKIAREH